MEKKAPGKGVGLLHLAWRENNPTKQVASPVTPSGGEKSGGKFEKAKGTSVLRQQTFTTRQKDLTHVLTKKQKKKKCEP